MTPEEEHEWVACLAETPWEQLTIMRDLLANAEEDQMSDADRVIVERQIERLSSLRVPIQQVQKRYICPVGRKLSKAGNKPSIMP